MISPNSTDQHREIRLTEMSDLMLYQFARKMFFIFLQNQVEIKDFNSIIFNLKSHEKIQFSTINRKIKNYVS
jgi:hypothetical protein